MCGSAAGSPGTGARAHLAGSVLMGLPRLGALEFAGTVGSGLSMAELRKLTALLQSLEQPMPPFTSPLPPGDHPARPVGPPVTLHVSWPIYMKLGRLGAAGTLVLQEGHPHTEHPVLEGSRTRRD